MALSPLTGLGAGRIEGNMMEASSKDQGLNQDRGYRRLEAGDLEEMAFLGSMGFRLTSRPSELNFAGDIVMNDEFLIGRYRHDAATFEYFLPDHAPRGNRILLLACLEGEVTMHSTTGSAELKPLDVVQLQPEELTGGECLTSTTCIFVVYRAAEANKHYEMLTGPSSEVYLRIFEAATSSLLQSPPEKLEPGFVQVQRGLEELAKATAIHSQLHPEVSDSPLGRVYTRGMALIRSMATDPDANIEMIANDMQVSRSYLLRAFKVHKTTPSYELRSARLSVAKQLLDDGLHMSDAAMSSGFGPVRNLRRALQEDS